MASPHLGDTAPDFTAPTTEGEISFLDWKGDSWAVFFSHPADYTPVCTTELGRVGQLSDEWVKRQTKVIALSVDSVQDHNSWKPDVEEVSKTTIGYPIIADEDKKVAELYDMIHPGEGDTRSVRSGVIIGPDNLSKLMHPYPKSGGRNCDETLRGPAATPRKQDGQGANRGETERRGNRVCEWWTESEGRGVGRVTNARNEAANTTI